MLNMFQEDDGNAGRDDSIISPPELSQTSGILFSKALKSSEVEEVVQVTSKHMVHEDDIDVGKDEHIVEIERKIVIMTMEIPWL